MADSSPLTKQIRLLPLVLLFLLQVPLYGAHIIGGEMSYVCLGGGNYRITMKIYRDCFGQGAEFDGAQGGAFAATVSVYRGDNNTPFINFDNIGAPVIRNIQPNLSNPCLQVPPNICVEEGVYTFNVNLPPSTLPYHISYQRCCRNNTISNLLFPGDVGATYTIEISPEAQLVCNNSPTFTEVPPIAICVGEPIDFDFSAQDADGDQLVYSLCSPLNGGGNNTDAPETPTGVAPNPDLPPPYPEVNFLQPFYSAGFPMLADPQLSIDPNTGFITGVPTSVGQFVVGVCVEEYRNGQLLSVTLRDFQFNVVPCEVTVLARIDADEILDDGSFRVISCGALTVNIINQSIQQQFINDWIWNFEVGGIILSSSEWNPSITFPSTGSYPGTLTLNPGTVCADTANILIDIFPEIVADFSFSYDTCTAGPVTFTNTSYTDAGPNALVSWNWEFGDGNQSDEFDPVHTYNSPDYWPVSLTVVDTNECRDTRIRELPYFPVPEYLIVAPNGVVVCQPARVLFDNLSNPISDAYDIVWEFGDGGSSGQISPTYVYQDTGLYSVFLSVTSPLGCYVDTIFTDLIEVLPRPLAAFSFTPEQLSNFEPTAFFQDESIDAARWNWEFDNIGLSFEQNPVYTFPDTGLQQIRLVVTHENGCRDTAYAQLDVVPLITYHLPNAFTPNADGVNEGFRGAGFTRGIQNFQLQIWNRYGEMIFETHDPEEPWLGRKFNTGEKSPPGVYVLRVSYIEPRGKFVELRGFVTLIR